MGEKSIYNAIEAKRPIEHLYKTYKGYAKSNEIISKLEALKTELD